MNDLIIDYVTRGGRTMAIKLPVNELGQVLSDDYLSDSEKRRLTALKLRRELGERETVFVTVH